MPRTICKLRKWHRFQMVPVSWLYLIGIRPNSSRNPCLFVDTGSNLNQFQLEPNQFTLMIRCGIHTFQADTQNLLRRNPSPTEIAPLARLIFTGIFAHQCSEGSMSPGGCARESRYGTERAAQFPFEGERAVPVKIFTGSNSNNCSKCKFPGLGNFFWRLYYCFLKVNSCFWSSKNESLSNKWRDYYN